MFWSKLWKSSWNCAWNLAFSVFISPIVWNMCENLHHESVYFKEQHNQQEYYWPAIHRTGAAVVSTLTSVKTAMAKFNDRCFFTSVTVPGSDWGRVRQSPVSLGETLLRITCEWKSGRPKLLLKWLIYVNLLSYPRFLTLDSWCMNGHDFLIADSKNQHYNWWKKIARWLNGLVICDFVTYYRYIQPKQKCPKSP